MFVAAFSVRGGADALWLVITICLATGAFILLVSKMPRKELDPNRQGTETTFSSRLNAFLPSDGGKFVLSIGFLGYISAAVEVNSHSQSSPARWAWLMNLAIEWFGPYGKVILWFVLGTILIILGLRRR